MQNEALFRDKPVWGAILTMAIPSVFTILIMVLYNMADMFFVGQLGGTDSAPVAAVAVVGPVFSVITAAATMIGVGGCATIAKAAGAGDTDYAKTCASLCGWAAILFGALCSVLILLFTDPLLHFLGTQKIEENPDWELAGIYADRGITGTSMKRRVEFKKMIAACKRGRIDLILTKSLSRFARNTVDSLEVVRMLRANGIGVIFEKENINTLTESSEFLLTLFSGFAQAESESISKNVIWGIQKSREAGNVPFQYTKLLGYRRGDDGQPEIVPEEAEVVKHIYRRYLDGCSLTQIKAELEADGVPTSSGIRAWTYQVIRNILTNERYIGDALLQKTYTTDCISKTVKKNQGNRPMVYVEGNHPAIVSKAIFYQVREEMTRRSSKRKVMQKSGRTEQGKYSAKYALSELLVCGECGTPYKRCTWARNGKKRIVWRCISRLEFGTKYCNNSPSIDEDKLHQAILDGINEYIQAGQGVGDELLNFASIVQQGKNADGIDPLTLRNRLDALTVQQAELLDKVLEDMENEILNAQLKVLAEEKQEILVQLGALQQDEAQRASQEARRRELVEWLAQQKSEFTEYEDTITRKYVERITVLDAETIRIKFRYTEVEIDKIVRK